MPVNDVIADATPSSGDPSGRKKKLITLAIIAGLVLGEGGAIYWAVNHFSGPPAGSQAAEDTEGQENQLGLGTEVEISLPEINAFNKKEGRLYLFSMEISIKLRQEDVEKVSKALEVRESTIKDRFNTVIRSADLQYLNEPGLDTIRRQFRYELDRILGDDQLILELLIPKFFQSPADV
jgi:flagellar basal body-associated protein FliL